MANHTSRRGVVSLTEEVRSAVPTGEAAIHLSRTPETLRQWASKGGPIQPVRVRGRLLWPVVELRRILGVGQ
jgi:hypothetical protein